MDFLDDIAKETQATDKTDKLMSLTETVTQGVLSKVDIASLIKSAISDQPELAELIKEAKHDAAVNRKSHDFVGRLVKSVIKPML